VKEIVAVKKRLNESPIQNLFGTFKKVVILPPKSTLISQANTPFKGRSYKDYLHNQARKLNTDEEIEKARYGKSTHAMPASIMGNIMG
jgi:hypothetical protein